MTAQTYIISFLLNDSYLEEFVHYGEVTSVPDVAKLLIVSSTFFDDGVYGMGATLPQTPFARLPDSDIPFLFGESRIERTADGLIILYADLVASAYFMLSRYEEIIKPNCRDLHGRFLAKDSVVFQEGYGMRPLVDDWGRYIRNLLRQAGVDVSEEKHGFRKIYLTHDVDSPFLLFRTEQVVKQWVKNLIHHGKKVSRPFYVYKHPENDPYNTFSRIIKVDNDLREKIGQSLVEPMYFLIAAGSRKTKSYCNILLKKYQDLIKKIFDSGATLGLHVSYEAGQVSELIKSEMARLLEHCPNSSAKSRHHFLRWSEPEHIDDMEAAGITDDFTLGYADSVGFRVGTCRPYYFINPRTQRVTGVLEHPMQVMECSLDRPNYMGLGYEAALQLCRRLIDTTYDFNGELVLLFHNPIWADGSYYGRLYDDLLEYVAKLCLKNQL